MDAGATDRRYYAGWSADDDSGLGFKFSSWAKLAGVVVLIGLAALILMLILTRAVYAWGFFGALMAFVAILLLVAWFYDRRKIEQYEEPGKRPPGAGEILGVFRSAQ